MAAITDGFLHGEHGYEESLDRDASESATASADSGVNPACRERASRYFVFFYPFLRVFSTDRTQGRALCFEESSAPFERSSTLIRKTWVDLSLSLAPSLHTFSLRPPFRSLFRTRSG